MKLGVRWCLFLAFVATQVRAEYLQNTDWTVNPSETGTSWATWSTVLTNGDIVAAGYVYTNSYALPRVMRITPTGTIVFDRAYKPSLISNNDVKALYTTQLPNGHIFVGCDVDASYYSATEGSYLMSLNEDGDILDESLLDVIPMRFSHNTAGQILIAGNNFIQIREENGSLVRSSSLTSTGVALGVSINQTTNGGYLVSGRISETSTSTSDGLLIKMASDLTTTWTQRYTATNGSQTIYCAVENPDGTITACGQENERRALLFKADAAGNPLWTRIMDGSASYASGMNTVIATPDNGSVSVGLTYSYPYIASYDAEGNPRWTSVPFYGTGMLRSITAASSNAYVIAGFKGFLGSQGGGDWLTYQLTINYDAPIVVNEILPFTPEMEGSHLPAEAGTPLSFSFDGYDPEGNPLLYTWGTNWVVASTNASYTFTPSPASSGQTIPVALSVNDGLNFLSYMWSVDVSNRPTVVTSLLPSNPSTGESNLTVNVNSSTNFVFDGYDPDGNTLHTVWTLDGQAASTDATYTYAPTVQDSGLTHTLTLTVIVIPDVEALHYTWNIEVPSNPPVQAPYAAEPDAPWNGETGVSAGRQPTISWTLSADSTHPVDYTKVYFSTSLHDITYFFPSTEVLNDGETVFTHYTAATALANETTYYWRVVSVNAQGETASATFSFTTGVVPEPPYEPYALSPYNQTTSVWIDASPLLSWGCSYDSSHPVDACDLYLSTNANAVTSLDIATRVLVNSPMSYGSGSYPAPEPLQQGQTYYWRVICHNSTGSSTGQVTSFTTEVPLTPPVSYGFETFPATPTGWATRYNTTGDGGANGANLKTDWSGWGSVSGSPLVHTGSNAIGIYGGMPALHWLISPLIQPAASTSVNAWLYHGTNEWQNTVAPLHLLVYAEGAWHVLRTWTASDTTYYDAEISVSLAAYAGKTVRIAWVLDLSNSGAPVALDDLSITGPSTTDTDSDGLLDTWEITQFGNLDHTAEGDSDSDGRSNLDEYIAGTDPTKSSSRFEVLGVTYTGNSVVIRWSAVADRVYNIYWTADLTQSFTLIASGIQGSTSEYTHTSKQLPTSGYYKMTVQMPE
jgi:hypothetical protein